MGQTSLSLCVCVCVRERERERERQVHLHNHIFLLFLVYFKTSVVRFRRLQCLQSSASIYLCLLTPGYRIEVSITRIHCYFLATVLYLCPYITLPVLCTPLSPQMAFSARILLSMSFRPHITVCQTLIQY